MMFGFIRKFLLSAILLVSPLVCLSGYSQGTDSSNPQFRSTSSFFPEFSLAVESKPGQVFGVEAGASLLTSKWTPSFLQDALVFGPRAHVRFSDLPSSQVFELIGGGESVLWFVNAVGIGGAADLCLPVARISGDSSGQDVHARFSGLFQVRVRRFGDFGAWALRTQISWDTRMQWSIGGGITLQLDGVPGILL